MKSLFSILAGLILMMTALTFTSCSQEEQKESSYLSKNNTVEIVSMTKKDSSNNDIVVVTSTYWKNGTVAKKYTDTLNVACTPTVYVSVLQDTTSVKKPVFTAPVKKDSLTKNDTTKSFKVSPPVTVAPSPITKPQ